MCTDCNQMKLHLSIKSIKLRDDSEGLVFIVLILFTNSCCQFFCTDHTLPSKWIVAILKGRKTMKCRSIWDNFLLWRHIWYKYSMKFMRCCSVLCYFTHRFYVKMLSTLTKCIQLGVLCLGLDFIKAMDEMDFALFYFHCNSIKFL